MAGAGATASGAGAMATASGAQQPDNGNLGNSVVINAITTDPSLISWSGLTGMTPVGTAPSSTMTYPTPATGYATYGNIRNNNLTSQPQEQQQDATPAAAVTMTSVRQKILELDTHFH